MSSIAGIISLDGWSVDPTWLDTMLDSLAHCGSEWRSVLLQGGIGMGYLGSWPAVGGSRQIPPMERHGRFVITGDVRLDNREELGEGLPEGYRVPRGDSDCSLVLAAYQAWGEACLQRLVGDFAFAIWDAGAQKLFCARDQMGVRPFYYALLPERMFIFGSEIKAVLAVPGVSDAIHELRVADAFVHLINDPVTTYYSDVKRLPAAHCLSIKEGITTRRYWRLDPERELRLASDREYAEGFREHFSRAVHCRVSGGQPVGSMLSGGLDSSAVACVARNWLRAQGRPKLRTFSAVFDEVKECDERPYIRTVLEQGHCEPNFIVLDSLSPLGEAASIMRHLDEPISAGNLYLSWNAYRKAQEQGIRVILDGFDGDTTVSHGSFRLVELARSRRWWDLARELRGGSRNFGGDFWLDSWCRWIWKYHPGARRANRVWSRTLGRLSRGQPGVPAEGNPIDFLNPDFVQRCGLGKPPPAAQPPLKCERERHFQMLEREIMTKCVELLAHTSAAFNVEVRFPFMDIRLIEYCLSLPSEQKMRGGFTRYVMRTGMTGVLPEKIRMRGGKSNLAPSFQKGLFKFERDNLGGILRGEATNLGAYVNMRRIKECLDRFQRGAATDSEVTGIWTAAGLALWLRNRRREAKPFILRREGVKQQ